MRPGICLRAWACYVPVSEMPATQALPRHRALRFKCRACCLRFMQRFLSSAVTPTCAPAIVCHVESALSVAGHIDGLIELAGRGGWLKSRCHYFQLPEGSSRFHAAWRGILFQCCNWHFWPPVRIRLSSLRGPGCEEAQLTPFTADRAVLCELISHWQGKKLQVAQRFHCLCQQKHSADCVPSRTFEKSP